MRYFPSIKRLVGIAAIAVAVWAVVPRRAESSIAWQPLEPASLDAARHSGKPAVVDFVADWCIPCREMERTTFRDPQVREQAARFAMFMADITSESEQMDDLADRYQVRGVPTVIVFDSSGTEVQRLTGYTGPAEMAKAMREVR
jgi:thiol:disulfide interchange protein DsbD